MPSAAAAMEEENRRRNVKEDESRVHRRSTEATSLSFSSLLVQVALRDCTSTATRKALRHVRTDTRTTRR
jgi:hypothetical protein